MRMSCTRRCVHDGNWLVGCALERYEPIQSVLQNPGDAVRVLRAGDQKGVCIGNGGSQVTDGLWRVRLAVGVEGGKRAESPVDRNGERRPRKLGDRPAKGRINGFPTETTREREEMHDALWRKLGGAQRTARQRDCLIWQGRKNRQLSIGVGGRLPLIRGCVYCGD